MRIKTNFSFWLTLIAIVALSVVVVFCSFSLSSTAIGPRDGGFELGIFRSLVKESGLDDYFWYLVTQIVSKHKQHHGWKHRIRSCDEKKWNSELISIYNVSLTLTVDLKGCANFSSVQKAVDAVPDYASSRTLILIQAGVYRSLSSKNTFKSSNYIPFSPRF